MKLERRIWVLQGALEQYLCLHLLEKIASKHEEIGTVPSGYFYPELFIERETDKATQ